MTAQILFVQGGGAVGTHDEWDARLVESLERALGAGYAIRYPLMPDEGDPHYAIWKAALLEQFATLDDGAILVGHSIGGTILINTLAEEALGWRPAGIFLIATPFVGEGGWPSDEIPPRQFSDRLPPGVPVFLYQGSADAIVSPAHAGLYAKAIPQAVVRTLAGADHQLDEDLSAVAADIRAIAGG
jgi:predicted alpha/beta hydrolase family esterase